MAYANTYDIGDVVHLTAVFTNMSTGLPVDPSTVTVVVMAPDTSETTYTYPATVIRDSTGNYHVDIPVTSDLIAGRYRHRWTSTGTGKASLEGWFLVRARLVP